MPLGSRERSRSGVVELLEGAAVAAAETLLADESRRTGHVELIGLPVDMAGVITVIDRARHLGLPVTISAGRTGVVAGAVPEGGALLSLERLGGITGLAYDEGAQEFRLRCGPALTLSQLQRAVASAHLPLARPLDESGQVALARLRREVGQWVFPCDPTEPSAQVGGMVASNASGAATFRYGPMRRHVRALTVVLLDGSVIEIRRGQATARRGEVLQWRHANGVLAVSVPRYVMPATKHAAGYHAADELDLVDLFIGSEGTLGVIVEVELALTRVEGRVLEAVIPVTDRPTMARVVASMRRAWRAATVPGELIALESVDAAALALVGRVDADALLWAPAAGDVGQVFATLRCPADPSPVLEALADLVVAAGADPARIGVALGAPDLARFKHFRHAVPEAVNRVIAARRAHTPQLTKLGTDMAVPDEHLADLLDIYYEGLSREGLEYVVFGHIGDNHLHVNILPRHLDDYTRGRVLYETFAAEVVRRGGSVSAEHGIGKLKRYLMDIQYSSATLAEMHAVKRAFDPDWRLGRGTLFPAP